MLDNIARAFHSWRAPVPLAVRPPLRHTKRRCNWTNLRQTAAAQSMTAASLHRVTWPKCSTIVQFMLQLSEKHAAVAWLQCWSRCVNVQRGRQTLYDVRTEPWQLLYDILVCMWFYPIELDTHTQLSWNRIESNWMEQTSVLNKLITILWLQISGFSFYIYLFTYIPKLTKK